MKEKNFPGLPVLTSDEQSISRVCIISPEMIGLTKNGGIGTACTSLAKLLAAEGNHVTFLYTGDIVNYDDIERNIKYYANLNIKLSLLNVSNVKYSGNLLLRRSLAVFDWLTERENDFDIIHFADWQGNGYYTILSKTMGLYFQDTILAITTHGSNLWVDTVNSYFIDDVSKLEQSFMEKRSVELADVVISPSKYMLNFLLQNGWKLPQNSFVQPYVVPPSFKKEGSKRGEIKVKVDELVFFGRLEERKGLDIFCEALDILSRNVELNFRVTFLGRFAQVNGQHAGGYILDKSKKWKFMWQMQVLEHDELNKFLTIGNKLIVIPSKADNSPNTVYECLASKLPFIVSDSGGAPELIDRNDWSDTLFSLSPKELAVIIEKKILDGATIPNPNSALQESDLKWSIWHKKLKSFKSNYLPVRKQPDNKLFVSVCIAHYNQAMYLKQALQSLEAQDYKNFEVVLVDDGSTDEDSIKYLQEIEPDFKIRGWKIIYQSNKYLGAARNVAVQHSKGDYILFMDADNIAKPNELSIFTRSALVSDADILTCFSNIFESDNFPNQSDLKKIYTPVGAALSLGIYNNCFGDANALIKRTVFEKLGGYTELVGIGFEDYEFYARAIIQGFTLEVIPQALFWYRNVKSSMTKTTSFIKNSYRAHNPYFQFYPQLRDFISYSINNINRQCQMSAGLYMHNDMDAHYKRLNMIAPNSVEAYSILVEIAIQNNNNNAAIALLNTLFSIDPDNVYAHETMGYLLYRTDNFDEAIKFFLQATNNDSIIKYGLEASYCIKNVLLKNNKNENALFLLNRIYKSLQSRYDLIENRIRDYVSKINILDKKIALVGVNESSNKVFCYLENVAKKKVSFFLENNPLLWDTYHMNVPVNNIMFLQNKEDFILLLSSPDNEIYCRQLEDAGLKENYHFWVIDDKIIRKINELLELSSIMVANLRPKNDFSSIKELRNDSTDPRVQCNEILIVLAVDLLRKIQGKVTVLFGTGSTSSILTQLINIIGQAVSNISISYYIDNANSKWDQLFFGKNIRNPEFIRNEKKEQLTIVVASQYYQEIYDQLKNMGYEENVHFFNGYRLDYELENIVRDFSDGSIPSWFTDELVLRLKESD